MRYINLSYSKTIYIRKEKVYFFIDYLKINNFATLLNPFCHSKIYNMYDYFTCAKISNSSNFKSPIVYQTLSLYICTLPVKNNQRNCIKI